MKEQTSSVELSWAGHGKTNLFEKQHPPGGRAHAQRTLQCLFCKHMVLLGCLVAESPEIMAQEACTEVLWQKSLAHGASLPPGGPTVVLLSKRMVFGAGSWAIP